MKPTLVVSGLVAVGAVAAVAVTARALTATEAAPAVAAAPRAAPVVQVVAPTAPAASQATAGAERNACQFTPGATLAYRVKMVSSTPVVLPGAPADRAMQSAVSSVLRLQTLRLSDDGAVLVGQLSELEVKTAGLSSSDLAAPFLLEVGRDCRLLQFGRSASAIKEQARNQQALVWGALFSLTPGASTVEDSLGQFEATFSRVRGGTAVERHQAQYHSMWHSGASRVPASGLLTVELGAGPWFESLTSHGSAVVEGGSTSWQVEMQRAEPNPPLSLAVSEADFIWEDLLPYRPVGRKHATRPFTKYDIERRDKVRNLSLDTALEQFNQRAVSGAGIQETWPELSAWFEVHPEGIETAVARLHERRIPKHSVAPLYTAIGKARVPQAREALLKMRRDANEPPMSRLRATFNLLDREDVGPELAHELSSEAVSNMNTLAHKENFLRGESLLALGMMAGLRGEPRLEEVARQTFTNVLTSVSPESQVAHSAFKGMGNLGDPKLLPLVEKGAASSDMYTRMAAAHAFRRMPPKESEAEALAWLKRETHPFVKRQLYITIRRQYFDAQVGPSEAMTKQAMADLATTKAPIDRKNIIRFLAKSTMKDQPEFRKFLVAQARRERNSGILNTFTDILSPSEVSEALR